MIINTIVQSLMTSDVFECIYISNNTNAMMMIQWILCTILLSVQSFKFYNKQRLLLLFVSLKFTFWLYFDKSYNNNDDDDQNKRNTISCYKNYIYL